MQIRCPHCHQPIELVNDDPSGDMTCESCGSGFNLASDGETVADDGSHANSVGHFTLVDRLGQGAFGSVWKALDTELDRTVAVKIPRKDQLSSTESELFLREARSAAQLRHPNIVPVHEVGREDGTLYIVSDFIQGLSLADWLTGQQLTSREAVELCVTVAQALHHAHEAGVVHRDLKPANIMLDDLGQPHIMDFGLARREAGEITMTIEGKLLGTPAYMPPEQARGDGHNADRRSDLYSLGVILFELLTGDTPFRGNQRMLLHQVLHEEPLSPRRLNQSVPRDLETITLKCLQKDPDRRFQTTAEFAADLDHWLAGEPISARPVSAIERSWRWCRRKPALAGVWAVATVLLLTLGIGGSLFAVQQANNATEQTRLRSKADADRKSAVDAGKKAEAERQNAVAAQTIAQANEKRAQDAEANAKSEADKALRNFRIAERNAYNSDMLLVQRDWETVSIGHLRELLDRYRDRDSLIGFEWGYWNRLAHSERLTLRGHTDEVRSVAFSPDGRWLASAGEARYGQAGEVLLWDAATGRKTGTLKGHTGSVHSVAFGRHDRLVSAGGIYGKLGEVIVWDTRKQQKVLALDGHSNDVYGVAFSPDGMRVASASRDGSVKVWNAETGKETLTFKGHSSVVWSVAFSPDGTQLASGSFDNTIMLWDATTGQIAHTFEGHTSYVVGLEFSPDGTQLASASTDKTLKLWDLSTGMESITLAGHADEVHSVCFSPHGKWLASACGSLGKSGDIKVWDVGTGKESVTFKGHTYGVNDVAFSPNGTRLASASRDGTVKVWDLSVGDADAPTGQEGINLGGRGSVSFSPDGKRLASSAEEDAVIVWDSASGQKLLTMQAPGRNVTYSPDGTRLAGSQDGTVVLWDANTGEVKLKLTGHRRRVNQVSFNQDGTRLASASEDSTVKVWDMETEEEIFTFGEHSGPVNSVSFSPDGAYLASASDDKMVLLWDAVTGRRTHILKGHGRTVTCLDFSRDGKWLASTSEDTTLKLWKLSSQDGGPIEAATTLKGHTHFAQWVVFSPDGQRLASASHDQSVKVWDVVTGHETLTLKGHTTPVARVCFSPNGMRLVSSNWRSVKVWDARPWTPDLRAQSRARGLLTMRRNSAESLDELQESIRSDQTIGDMVRKQALDWAELFWKNRQAVSQ